MMIENLRIKNFKSIKDVELDLSRVNLLIGPPNSGKSNIIEAFALVRLLSPFSEHPSRTLELSSILRFRNYAELFHFYDTSTPIELFIDEKQILFHIKDNFLHLTYKNMDFRISNSSVDGLFYHPTKSENHRKVITSEIGRYNIKYYKFSKDQMLHYRSHLNLTTLVEPFGENFEEAVFYNNKIYQLLNDILRELGGYSLKRVVAPERVMLELVNQDDYVFSWEVVSDGILKFIFDITAIKSNQSSTIVLEEPEAGMFPYLINEICEIIAESSNQFIFSTHNPYFIDGLLENIDKEDISVFFTKYNLKNRRTEVKCIKGKEIEDYVVKYLDLIVASKEVSS